VSDEDQSQVDAFVSPGALLKAAREQQELSTREVADRLNWMPAYPAIIEQDEFQALRRPAFARGYVKAYGKLLDLDEARLLDAFDRQFGGETKPQEKRVSSRPVQLQRTGLGVIIGLVLLLLLVLAIWWWRGETPAAVSVLPAAGTGYVALAPAANHQDTTGER
jgi:cytoskeleton protein RodZ